MWKTEKNGLGGFCSAPRMEGLGTAMKRAFCGLPGTALRRKAKGKSALAAKMPVGPTAPLTNMLVLETLLKNYYDGSMEKLNEAKKEYPGFSNAELLLLHYTADELTNGNLVWLQ